MPSTPPFTDPSPLNFTTSANAGSFLPADYGALVVQPAFLSSIAAQICTTASTSANSYRIPVITGDPLAAWTNEGQEIVPSDAYVDEIIVTPSKLAALSIISAEMADDSNPATADVIGAGLARDCARRIDEAMWSGLPAPAPAGIGSVNGVQGIEGSTVFADLDVFSAAVAMAEMEGAATSHFVANPITALRLAQVKAFAGSASPLLGLGLGRHIPRPAPYSRGAPLGVQIC